MGKIDEVKFWQGTKSQYDNGAIGESWYNWSTNFSDGWKTIYADINEIRSDHNGGAVYENGKYVVVNDNKYLMLSNDGFEWQKSQPFTYGKNGLAFGNDLFVAVGSNLSVAYSSDGETWVENTLTSSLSSNTDIYDIVFYKNKFVAVGNGLGFVSVNGIDWTEITVPSGNWRYLTYGNGRFVAVAYITSGSGSATMYSDDGINWTTSTLPSDNYYWQGVTFGNGKFVAVNGGGSSSVSFYAYSEDGINWTQGTLPGLGKWNSIAYGNGVFVAVSSRYYNYSVYSADGINWTNFDNPDTSNIYIGRLFFIGSRFLLFASDKTYQIIFSVFTKVTPIVGDEAYADENIVAKTVNGTVSGGVLIGTNAEVSCVDSNSLIEYGDKSFRPSSLQNFEFVAKIRTDSNISSSSGTQEILCVPQAVYLRLENNYLQSVVLNSGTVRIASLRIYSSTTYYVRLRYYPETTTVEGYSYTGKYLYIEYSEDGTTWTRSSTSISGGIIDFNYNNLNIGMQGVGNEKFIGTIFCNDCYIKIDGEYWWQGSRDATVSAVNDTTLTLNDTRTFTRNINLDKTEMQNVGQAHPDYICYINEVGIKIADSFIAKKG